MFWSIFALILNTSLEKLAHTLQIKDGEKIIGIDRIGLFGVLMGSNSLQSGLTKWVQKMACITPVDIVSAVFATRKVQSISIQDKAIIAKAGLVYKGPFSFQPKD